MVVAALGKLRGQTGSSTMSHVFRNKNVYSILPDRYGAPLGLYIIRISIQIQFVSRRSSNSCSRARSWSRSGGGAAAPTPEPRVACGTRERDRGGARAASDHATLQRRTPRFVESQLIRYPTPRCTRVEYRIKAQRSTTVSTLRTPSRSRIRALEPSPRVESPPRVGQLVRVATRGVSTAPPHIRLKHNMDIGAVLKGQTPLADSLSHTAIGIRV